MVPLLRKRLRLFLFLALTLLPAGCHISYYGQAITGQMEIWNKQKPAARLLQQPDLDPELADRLRLTQEILAFAESELLLPHDGNYTRYADLGREFVLWSVFAAPALDVEPISWTYPVLGDLDYRGYFKKHRAEAFAGDLRRKGHDVAIAGVPAYSTLGWFEDPLLNTFIDYKEERLAGLIFHELAHKKYYRHGDTEFSEAFAVAIEEEGVKRWLSHRRDTEKLARYQTRGAKIRRFVQRILDTREELNTLYTGPLPEAEKLARKQRILTGLQTYVRDLLTRAGRTPDETFWLRDDINNAHLNIVAAYHLKVPEFEALLADCEGDLPLFYERVKDLP